MEVNMCRLCTVSDAVLINVFDKCNEETSLATKIHLCFGVKITEEDFVSKSICKSCYFFANTAYEHRIASQKRDALLKQKYQNSIQNKNVASYSLDPSQQNGNQVSDVSKEVSQDMFFNSLQLKSRSEKRVIEVNIHPSVKHILLKYPKLVIPKSCYHYNLLPELILQRITSLRTTRINNDVWSINRNNTGNGQTSMILTRVSSNDIQNNKPSSPKKKKTRSIWCTHKRAAPKSKKKINITVSVLQRSNVSVNEATSSSDTNISRLTNKSTATDKRNISLTDTENQAYKRVKISARIEANNLYNGNSVTNTPKPPVLSVINSMTQANSCNNSMGSSAITDNLLTVGQEVATFICRTCGTIFEKEKSLLEHQKKHKSSIPCVLCSKKFNVVEELVKHNKDLHRNLNVVITKLTEEEVRLYTGRSSLEQETNDDDVDMANCSTYSDITDDKKDMSNITFSEYIDKNLSSTEGSAIQKENNLSESSFASNNYQLDCASLLRAALQPQILFENKTLLPEATRGDSMESTSSNIEEQTSLNNKNEAGVSQIPEQIYIIDDSDADDDIQLIHDEENAASDMRSSLINNTDYTEEEHIIVNSIFRKCRKSVQLLNKKNNWILNDFNKLLEKFIIPIDIELRDDFNIRYCMRNTFDSKVKSNDNQLWDCSSAIDISKDDLNNTTHHLTLEPFLTLHRDVARKPTAAVGGYTNQQADSVTPSVQTQTVPTAQAEAIREQVAPVPLKGKRGPVTEAETKAAVASIQQAHLTKKNTIDPENAIKCTAIFKPVQPNVNHDELTKTSSTVDQPVNLSKQLETNEANTITPSPGSSQPSIVLNGLPFPIVTNIHSTNLPNQSVIVQTSTDSLNRPAQNYPITETLRASSNTVLRVSSVNPLPNVQVASPVPVQSRHAVKESETNTAAKPYIRIRNLAELTGNHNQGMDKSQSLREMYSKTLTKYVSNNPNSLVNTYNSDEYLQIS